MKPPECRVCGKAEWRHGCGGVNTKVAVVNTTVNTKEVPVNTRNRDRHQAGYMRNYMRVWRMGKSTKGDRDGQRKTDSGAG
jgi:hypothetical protein